MSKTVKEKIYVVDVSQVFYQVDGETEIYFQADKDGVPIPNRKTGKVEFFQFKHALTNLLNLSPALEDVTEETKRRLYILSCRANSKDHDPKTFTMTEPEYDLVKGMVDKNKLKPEKGGDKVDMLPPLLRNRLKDMIDGAKVLGERADQTSEPKQLDKPTEE